MTGARRPATRRIVEIDGLRGIALTLVVLFHLFGDGRVSGGVDVFLLISGFLLTLSLGRALRDGRPLGIRARWARTFSRLAPPAALVLLAVVALSLSVLPAAGREQTLIEVASSALYVENWQLIWSQLAYGAAGPDTSALQHFWSLSVQAQFFLVFPLLPLGVTLLASGRRARLAAFWTLLGVATAASFAYAWWANGVDGAAAYFSSFSRFWELGLGGLAAGAFLLGWRLPERIAPLTGWLGIALVLACGFLIDGGRSYPGPLALVPLGGALLVLFSSGAPQRWSATPLLSSRPLVALDGLSYGLYLWHWPILIAWLAVTGDGTRAATVGEAAGILACTVLLAVVTRRLLTRSTAWAVSGRRRRGAALSLAAALVGAVPASALLVADHVRPPQAPIASDCAGAAVLDPDRPECADDFPAGEFIPAVEDLRADDANRGECWVSLGEEGLSLCTVGAENPLRSLLAVGDSHNNVFVDVYEQLGAERGWAFDIAGRGGCQWLDPEAVPVLQAPLAQERCAEWREEVNGIVRDGDYDAILVVGSSRGAIEPPEGMTLEEFQTEMHLRAWAHRAGPETPIIALRDYPIFGRDQMRCLESAEAVAAGECRLPREVALRSTGLPAAVERAPNAHLIDLSDYMCAPEHCDQVVGGVAVSRDDGNHLTATFAGTLAPYLGSALAEILGD